MREAKEQARLLHERLRAQRKLCKSRAHRQEENKIRVKQVGFRILALAEHEEKTLASWLSVKLPTLQAEARHELLTDIVDEFIKLDIEKIIGMREPIAPKEKVLLDEAKAAVARCELHSWVCEQNTQKGLAPSVGALIRQRDVMGGIASKVSSEEAGSRKTRWASYKWVSRWRKKWNMPKAKIQDRDSPTPSEMRSKVRPDQLSSDLIC